MELVSGKCHMCYLLVCKSKMLVNILMARLVNCVHFNQLVDHLCNIGITS